MIRQSAKGTGYDNDKARDLLREAGIQAFRKQAGYVPKVDDKEIDSAWIAKDCIVPYRRDWRKELFSSVNVVAVHDLRVAYLHYMQSKGVRIGAHRASAFITRIVKQNRKFVDHDAA